MEDETLPTVHLCLRNYDAFCAVEAFPGQTPAPQVTQAILFVNELIRGGFALIDGDGNSFKVSSHPDAALRHRLAFVLSIQTGKLIQLQSGEEN